MRLSSDKNEVLIQWADMDNKSVTEYNVWRKTASQEEFDSVATVPAGIGNATDIVPDFDTTYEYSVSAVTSNYQSPKSNHEAIIPGPFNYWIADFYTQSVSKVSYDGAHYVHNTAFFLPMAIDIDPSTGSLWLLTLYPKQVVKLDLEGKPQFYRELDGTPADLALNRSTGEVFIATVGASSLVHLDLSGTEIGTLSCGLIFTQETHLAVNAVTGDVWVAVSDSSRVITTNPNSPASIVSHVAYHPKAVAVMSSQGIAWVATDSGVVSIDQEGITQAFLTGYRISDLDINDEKQEVWVIAYRQGECTIQVISHANGNWAVTSWDKSVYGSVTKIRVNPGLEQQGVLLYDQLHQRIVRLRLNGEEIGSLSGFSSRLDLVVEQ